MNIQVEKSNKAFEEAIVKSFAYLKNDYNFFINCHISDQGNCTISYLSNMYCIDFTYFYGEIDFCLHSRINMDYQLSMGDLLSTIYPSVCVPYQASKPDIVGSCVERIASTFKESIISYLDDYSKFEAVCLLKNKRYHEMSPSLWLCQADDYWALGRKTEAINIYSQYADQISNLQKLRIKTYKKSDLES